MPTGYTCSVGDGDVTNLRDFALSCARNFGACLHQRDDDQKDLPKLREADDYHSNSIKGYKTKLKNLKRLTDKGYIQKFKLEFFDNLRRNKEYLNDKFETKIRYEKMLESVKSWNSPSSEHDNLKNFMISQLEESIDWDCDPEYYLKEIEQDLPSDENILELKSEEIKSLEENIEYHIKRYEEEVERVNNSNKWILDLYKSLEKL